MYQQYDSSWIDNERDKLRKWWEQEKQKALKILQYDWDEFKKILNTDEEKAEEWLATHYVADIECMANGDKCSGKCGKCVGIKDYPDWSLCVYDKCSDEQVKNCHQPDPETCECQDICGLCSECNNNVCIPKICEPGHTCDNTTGVCTPDSNGTSPLTPPSSDSKKKEIYIGVAIGVTLLILLIAVMMIFMLR